MYGFRSRNWRGSSKYNSRDQYRINGYFAKYMNEDGTARKKQKLNTNNGANKYQNQNQNHSNKSKRKKTKNDKSNTNSYLSLPVACGIDTKAKAIKYVCQRNRSFYVQDLNQRLKNIEFDEIRMRKPNWVHRPFKYLKELSQYATEQEDKRHFFKSLCYDENYQDMDLVISRFISAETDLLNRFEKVIIDLNGTRYIGNRLRALIKEHKHYQQKINELYLDKPQDVMNAIVGIYISLTGEITKFYDDILRDHHHRYDTEIYGNIKSIIFIWVSLKQYIIAIESGLDILTSKPYLYDEFISKQYVIFGNMISLKSVCFDIHYLPEYISNT